MKKFIGLVVLGFQAFATDVYASPVMDLTIASDMAAVELSQLSQGSLWGVGLTRNDETRATVAAITFNAVGNLASMSNVRAGIGWKALYHDTFQRAFSLAVGGSFRYEPVNATGLGLEGQAYLAPQVLSTNDTERYHELMVRATFDLHARAMIFAGWTDKTVRYEDGAPAREVEIADGFMAGFALTF